MIDTTPQKPKYIQKEKAFIQNTIINALPGDGFPGSGEKEKKKSILKKRSM